MKRAEKLSDLDAACQKAMAHIHERSYADYFLNEGRTDILAYGIAFWKKRCKVVVERV